MKEIYSNFDKSLFLKAKSFKDFRTKCKEYLQRNNKDFDKFTMVDHDSLVGYISENLISTYIKSQHPDIELRTWEKHFDLNRILDILNENSSIEQDINYVQKYFYDRYDLQLSFNQKNYYFDIKSALTKKTPSKYWTFLYPVVQAHKKGKSGMILTYCVVEDLNSIESMISFVLVGYVSQTRVMACTKYTAGMKTRFNTINQIDNYETLLSRDYRDIETLFLK